MASENNNECEIEKRVGESVAFFRREAKLTQEDLAGRAEIDRSYLSEIETGKKNLSIRILVRIARALGVKISELLGE